MKTLSLLAVGLTTFAAAGIAASGGGSGSAVGTAGAASGGGHAGTTASAGHASSGPVGVGRAAAVTSGGGFRSANVGAGGGLRSTGLGTVGSYTSLGGGMGIARSSGFAASQGAAVRSLPAMPSVRNAWSDPVSPRVGASRSAPANNARAGQTLYPGTYGYAAANRPANGQSRHGRNGSDGVRGDHRYYYNNFPYPVYYPYLYGGYGYGGIGYDGAVGDYAGLTTDNNVADLGAPDFSTTPNNYYSYVAPTQSAPGADPSAASPQQPLPDAPAVGPQNPPTTAKGPGNAQQGPDSLVEAVQEELGKRGYFAGKPDAVYGDATKEAIRRFQTDRSLPATGRINEATLHALNLD